MLSISSSRVIEPVIMPGMTTVLEDSVSVSDKRAPFGEGEEELLLQ